MRPPTIIFVLALTGVLLACLWPAIEEKLFTGGCPWPFSYFHDPGNGKLVIESELSFTLAELKKHDGSDPALPIYIAVDGKVLDVSAGAKFYGSGAHYNQFAGRAATRALSLGSLKAEVRSISLQ